MILKLTDYDADKARPTCNVKVDCHCLRYVLEVYFDASHDPKKQAMAAQGCVVLVGLVSQQEESSSSARQLQCLRCYNH